MRCTLADGVARARGAVHVALGEALEEVIRLAAVALCRSFDGAMAEGTVETGGGAGWGQRGGTVVAPMGEP